MRARSLVPSSSLTPSSSLRVHWLGVSVYNVPREDYYPDDGQLPSDAWQLYSDGIPSAEALGAGSISAFNPTIGGVGIPSAEAFGAPDETPSTDRFPSSLSYPGTAIGGSRIFYTPAPILGVGIPSAEAFDSGWLEETIFDDTYPGGPVGPPRVGLRPAPGQYPGPLLSGPVEGPQATYKRIHFPKTTVFPSRSLFLDRYDATPVARRGWFVVIGRETLRVRKNGAFHTFKATFDHPLGNLNAHGVFSSDLSGKMPYVVDLSDGTETSELGGGIESVDLALVDASVELADADSFAVELEPTEAVEVDVA